jgi:hypothetical protein
MTVETWTTQDAWIKFVLATPILLLVVETPGVFSVSYYPYDVFYRSLANSMIKFRVMNLIHCPPHKFACSKLIICPCCEIWNSRGGDYEGYCSPWNVRRVLQYRRFRRTCGLHSRNRIEECISGMKMEAADCSETSVLLNKKTWYHIPENTNNTLQ